MGGGRIVIADAGDGADVLREASAGISVYPGLGYFNVDSAAVDFVFISDVFAVICRAITGGNPGDPDSSPGGCVSTGEANSQRFMFQKNIIIFWCTF